MRIHGLDFSSAPGRAKPLALARCFLDEGNERLELEGFEALETFEALAEVLRSPGPWAMGCDFPFSHPARLVREAGARLAAGGLPARWPMAWEDYLRGVASLDRERFKALMKSCPPDPRGVRERKRLTGLAANAASPMHVDFPPVGLMFHAGAPLLLGCPCQVIPQRMNGDLRLLFETYPGVFAERFCGHKGYKDGKPAQRADRAARRARMVGALKGERFRAAYGFTVSFDEAHARRMAADAKGDFLDALVCAAQAAWAWSRRNSGWGLPGPDALDPAVLAFEGWIMDPHCRAAPAR